MNLEHEKLSPREQVNRVTGPIAEKLHTLFPDLSPNHVTIIGLLGNSLALWLNEKALEKKDPKLRALAESKGKIVPETGRDLLELLGTRAGRLANVAVGNFMPEVKGIDLAKWFDMLAIVGNLKTSANRLNITQNNSIPVTLDKESQKAATERLKMLKILTALGFTTIGTIGYFSLKSSKKSNHA